MSLKPSLEVPAVAGAVERVVVRVRAGQASSSVDHVAAEEPLEIRLAGMSLAVTMLTNAVPAGANPTSITTASSGW